MIRSELEDLLRNDIGERKNMAKQTRLLLITLLISHHYPILTNAVTT